MHFWPIALIPKSVPLTEDAIWEAIIPLLEPYYIEREGPARKEYFSPKETENLRRKIRQPINSLPELAANLRQEWGLDCDVDEGGLYQMTTRNPNGKYEWFALPGMEYIWSVSEIPRDLQPSAVITPDGEWHETGIGNGKLDDQLTESEGQDIRTWAYAIIDNYPNCHAVMVDCHL